MGSDPVVLVTGAGGQVGRALAALLPGALLAPHSALDVTDARAVEEALAGVSVVVHLAALTDVDGCEAAPDRARAVNEIGSSNVVRAATSVGARVVYVSTDYVFDGRKGAAYEESDEPNPLNVYGRTKLAGERAVAEAANGTIVRTSWVFGEGRNFVRSILRAAESRASLQVVDDQRGLPTFAGDLARALERIVADRVDGTVHVAGAGSPATWADVAVEALGAAGRKTGVERVDSETYARRAQGIVAPRPRDSTLSLVVARGLGLPLGEWRDSLARYVRDHAGVQR
jgi:dTDP-4-dehydrorhamnose reductase